MKILITGSNGLLGQKLIDLYKKHPQTQLIATALGPDRYPQKEGYQYEVLDITDQQNVNEVISKHKPQVLINTAAMTNVDACELNQETCNKLNVEAVQYLIKACNDNNCHFIQVSTDFIFDGTHGPLTETETPKPLSYYGNSKLKAENEVIQNAKSWAILRTVLVYGVVNDMSRSNIVLWAKDSLQSGKSIQVVSDQFRTPTLAEDLAMGCMLAANKKAQGIYNISGKNYMSIFDLVYQVANFWNLDKSLITMTNSEGINQPAKRPPITGFNIQKAMNELGYNPHSFTEGLEIVNQQLTKNN
jgi:dTDP-4-dehydrorhamnose reductase